MCQAFGKTFQVRDLLPKAIPYLHLELFRKVLAMLISDDMSRILGYSFRSSSFLAIYSGSCASRSRMLCLGIVTMRMGSPAATLLLALSVVVFSFLQVLPSIMDETLWYPADSLLAVYACFEDKRIVALTSHRPEGVGLSFKSGFLSVSRLNPPDYPSQRISDNDWEVLDNDQRFRVWYAKDSSNLFKKESYCRIGRTIYEITSFYKSWDIVNGRVKSLAKRPRLHTFKSVGPSDITEEVLIWLCVCSQLLTTSVI